jgi:hypothetical protein
MTVTGEQQVMAADCAIGLGRRETAVTARGERRDDLPLSASRLGIERPALLCGGPLLSD